MYLALNTQTQEEVALKLIELGPDLDRQEIAAAERRGALLQRQLCTADQRIAQIRDFGELEGFFFIEMEYVEGQDLAELLRTGPLGIPVCRKDRHRSLRSSQPDPQLPCSDRWDILRRRSAWRHKAAQHSHHS